MADISDINSAQQTKIVGQDANGVETSPLVIHLDGGITAHLKDNVHNKPTTFSAFHALKISQEVILGNYRFSKDSLTDEHYLIDKQLGAIFTFGPSGTGMIMSTSADVGSKLDIRSVQTHFYQSGRGIVFKAPVTTYDTGVVGNIRAWGMRNENNGVFVRLDGTTLNLVILSSGVETLIPSNSWDTPVVHDGNVHAYYIQMQYYMAGNISLYRDDELVHEYRFMGTSSGFAIGSPDLKIYFLNENTTNNTVVNLTIGSASVVSEGGGEAVRLDEHPHDESLADLFKSVLYGKTDSEKIGHNHYNNVKVSELNELLVLSRLHPLQFGAIIRLLEKNNKLLEQLNIQMYSITGIKGD